MARKKSRVTGADDIARNAKTLIASQRDLVFKGLNAGALLVKKDAQINAPRREGNLRASGYVAFPKGEHDPGGPFKGVDAGRMGSRHKDIKKESVSATKSKSSRSDATVAVGFTAFYALKVEENPNAGAAGFDPSKDRPGMRASEVHSRVGGHKFLANALQGAAGKVKQAITAAAKLPASQVRA